jgi:hypothetical protein
MRQNCKWEHAGEVRMLRERMLPESEFRVK